MNPPAPGSDHVNLPAPAEATTSICDDWTRYTGKCRICGEFFRISRAAFNFALRDAGGDVFGAVSSLQESCSECRVGPLPGEYDVPTVGGKRPCLAWFDESAPFAASPEVSRRAIRPAAQRRIVKCT